jgi:hypothetical protein
MTSATRQVRQQWFSVGIFPLGQFSGKTGNRSQSAYACTSNVSSNFKTNNHETTYLINCNLVDFYCWIKWSKLCSVSNRKCELECLLSWHMPGKGA